MRNYIILSLSIIMASFINPLWSKDKAMIFLEDWVQLSQISKLTEDQWILVEFWATWCKPCHKSYPYIEEVQKKNARDLYVISLTKENRTLVESFLAKKPMKTAIAIDMDGRTFDRFGVREIPKAVLIAPDGTVQWEGHPAELKPERLARFIEHTSSIRPIPLSSKIRVSQKISTLTDGPVYHENDHFKWCNLSPDLGTKILNDNDKFHFTGSLKKLLSHALEIQEGLIVSGSDHGNIELVVYGDAWTKHKWEIVNAIFKQKGLAVEHQKKVMTVIRMEVVDSSKLWACNNIEWSPEAPKYLIGDSKIQANDLTVEKFAVLLGNSLDALITLVNPDQEPHDWDVHIKYRDLMSEQLKLDYGIILGPDTQKSVDVIAIVTR